MTSNISNKRFPQKSSK